jgi:heme-binding NEAT domain protein
MSKKLSLILSVFVLIFSLMCSAASAFAMGPSKDGVYEVPIEMWHAEKERTSMGDSYIVHTALLTVDGNEKTLTIAPAETSSDMQFWYYTDGSVKGDTKEVSQSSAVEIDGEKYDVAFEFPIKSDNEFVGVKFAASAMPLSPSARIKIDYDSAKKIGNVVKETTTKETPTVATTIKQSTTEQEELTASSESKSTNKGVIIIGVVAGVIIIGAVVGIVVKKKSNQG